MTLSEFFRQYFSTNLKDYPNIGIDLEISKIGFFITIALMAAIIILNIWHTYSALLIKRLIRCEAFDEENAKTLSDLKVNIYRAKFVILLGGKMKKIIRRVGEKEYNYEEYSKLIKDKKYKEEKVDYSTSKFYLDKNYKDYSSALLDRATPGVLNTLLECILLLSLYICLVFLAPEILTLINNFLG